MRFVGHDNEALDTLDLVGERFKQGHEHRVGEDPAVFGMIDNKNQLFRKQARIDRVTDIARTADGIISLQMPVVVPGQRCDAIAICQSKLVQRIGELFRTRETLAIGVTVLRVIGRDRHDLAVGKTARRVLGQRRDQKRRVHHQSVHRGFS